MMTFMHRDGQEYLYTDIPYMITVELLEKDHMEYKFLLEKYAEYKSTEEYQEIREEESGLEDHLTKKLNDTSEYDVWYSTHLHCLVYLAGEPSDFAKSERDKLKYDKDCSVPWYGWKTSIPEEDAIYIAQLMISLGAKMNIPNFYGETLLETLEQKGRLTGRENEGFANYMKIQYITNNQ